MNDLINRLIEFFKKPEEATKNQVPEGLCPICWGYQEYDGKIRKLYKDKQIDVNNHQDSYMLIQDFLVTHIDGIRLKKDLVEPCPRCQSNPDELPTP